MLRRRTLCVSASICISRSSYSSINGSSLLPVRSLPNDASYLSYLQRRNGNVRVCGRPRRRRQIVPRINGVQFDCCCDTRSCDMSRTRPGWSWQKLPSRMCFVTPACGFGAETAQRTQLPTSASNVMSLRTKRTCPGEHSSKKFSASGLLLHKHRQSAVDIINRHASVRAHTTAAVRR